MPRLSQMFESPALRDAFARAERDLPPETTAVVCKPNRPLSPRGEAARILETA